MSKRTTAGATFVVLMTAVCAVAAQPPAVDDSPARPGEWGFRPRDGQKVALNPPAFAWRPQKQAAAYELEVSPTSDFTKGVYRVEGLWLNVHCPPEAFVPGRYYWRYRYVDKQGQRSRWSKARSFDVPRDAVEFPMPLGEELLERVPKQHPRLFIRPEDVALLREQVKGPLRDRWRALLQQADRLVADPPSIEEPPRYGAGWKRGEPRWLERWWGNRRRVIAVVDGAATLSFAYLISGEKKYGQAARRLMLAAASWNPRGATSYRYNDEAAMPVLYMLSRAYDWGHGALSEADRQRIRACMAIRGREVFDVFRRRNHTWYPYSSHRNRAWHYLGELAIAFLGEIPEAEKWLEYSVNIFFCCYPVWSDSDGGWHEGTSYWSSYINRQTWWLDVMRSALRIDGYKRPFFRRAGYFPMYVMPPGTRCGGFGDSRLDVTPRSVANTIAVLARGAQNGHWQWYAEQTGGSIGSGYLGLLRARMPAPKPEAPGDLPQSKLFRGTGLAMLHTNLLDIRYI